MKKYTKQQIIGMLKRHCIHDDQFGMEYDEQRGVYCTPFKGITLQILSDERDYNMLCDLLEIEESER